MLNIDLPHTLDLIYNLLLEKYGIQRWWPADSAFEIMVGAVLTQGTSWTNVEKALDNLKDAAALNAKTVRELPTGHLADLIHPAGFHNTKAIKLKALSEYLGLQFNDNIDSMKERSTIELRSDLLDVYGIGEETADAIILYAIGKPVFVVDAFTRRIYSRLGLVKLDSRYSELQAFFQEHLPEDVEKYAEYHALIVQHAKVICRTSPKCERCCLLKVCPTGFNNLKNRHLQA